MRILVCGDRDWDNYRLLRKTLRSVIQQLNHGRCYSIASSITIIHGAAKGADKMAGKFAREIGANVKPYKANWLRYGRAAGPIRNRIMLVEGKPDIVIAFHNDITKSKGTKNMLEQAEKAGVKNYLFPRDRKAFL